jgi:hypothetical protein
VKSSFVNQPILKVVPQGHEIHQTDIKGINHIVNEKAPVSFPIPYAQWPQPEPAFEL